jgi:hypothetical protein
VKLFVLDVEEFASLVEFAKTDPACTVEDTGKGYFRISTEGPVTFNRRKLGFDPAIWYGAFTGGLDGRIVEFGRDEVQLAEGDSIEQ